MRWSVALVRQRRSHRASVSPGVAHRAAAADSRHPDRQRLRHIRRRRDDRYRPGFATEESERVLVDSLSELGICIDDVAQILVTHVHWDHYSQALKLQRRHGISVGLGRGERHAIARGAEQENMHGDHAIMLEQAGASVLAECVRTLQPESFQRGIVTGSPDRWIDSHARIDCGATHLIGLATPGHTPGHMVFKKPDDGAIFTGDHMTGPRGPVHGVRSQCHRAELCGGVTSGVVGDHRGQDALSEQIHCIHHVIRPAHKSPEQTDPPQSGEQDIDDRRRIVLMVKLAFRVGLRY